MTRRSSTYYISYKTKTHVWVVPTIYGSARTRPKSSSHKMTTEEFNRNYVLHSEGLMKSLDVYVLR